MYDETSFSIKYYNNTATQAPCTICDERTDPEVGPELFLGDYWALVCHECGYEYARELVHCLDCYRSDLMVRGNPKYQGRYLALMTEATRDEIGEWFANEDAANAEALRQEHGTDS